MAARIRKGETRAHAKASERYVEVGFTYPGDVVCDFDVPIEYRRTGLDLKTDDEIDQHLASVYEACAPEKRAAWLAAQDKFWATKPGAATTKAFYDGLASFHWMCVGCELPNNPNWARRIQDLKEFGYTIATNTSRFCPRCRGRKTHLLLLPIPRSAETGYETWSPALRAKIVALLNKYDAYEGKKAEHLLPDHKFPEIRWDATTRRETLEHLTDEEIRRDFQLMTNQRNQQKREVCRRCYQEGTRGYPFGIEFYYAGGPAWPESIPQTGDGAAAGCHGCGWYDLEAWREAVASFLPQNSRKLPPRSGT